VKVRVWLAFFLLALLWGSSYLFIRVGVRHLSPLALVAMRLTIAAIAITVLASIRRHRLGVSRPVLARLVIVSTINTAVPFFLISWGEVSVPSGLASVLNSTVPIFSVLLAGALLRDEPLSATRLGGVAIGFVGVVVLLSRDLGQTTVNWTSVGGQVAIVLAAVCYAVGAVVVRRELRGTPPMTIATYSIWISAVETAVASALLSRPDFSAMLGETWFAIIWLGVLGSALAYMFAFFILASWGVARYTLVAYMLPMVGLTLGILFLGESVDWRILAGSALVVTGVALASTVRQARAKVEDRPASSRTVCAVD
jgi:drug/metabolite transporter (DMT)-like permease